MWTQMKRSEAERVAGLIEDADTPEKVVAVLMAFGVEAQKQGMECAASMADYFAKQVRTGVVGGSEEQAVGAAIVAARLRENATARICPDCGDPAPLGLWGCLVQECPELQQRLRGY